MSPIATMSVLIASRPIAPSRAGPSSSIFVLRRTMPSPTPDRLSYVRFALARFPDSQGVARIRIFAHARGAWLITEPHGLFGTTDVLVAAGPGVEYYTRLRHFSVGLAVDGVFALKAKAPGIACVPSLRYTF